MEKVTVFLRVDFAEGCRLGPGKIALLEAIDRHSSIAAAARELGMGYRTAWLLGDSLNVMFVEPVVATQPGRREGGTTVTKFGEHVIERFRRMEELSRKAIQTEITALRRALK